MDFTPDATVAVNDYVDRVRLALPLAPSARIVLADGLYDDIRSACARAAAATGKSVIDIGVVSDQLASLGDPNDRAQRIAQSYQSGGCTWPGDYLSAAMKQHRIRETVGRAARAAAVQGGRAARVSMDVAAGAFDTAAKLLRETAEKIHSAD